MSQPGTDKLFCKCELESDSQIYLKQPKTTTLNVTASGSYVDYTLSAYIQLYMNHETCDTCLFLQESLSFPTSDHLSFKLRELE